MARLIDAENYRNLFNEEFKKTMELIRKGETHLDTLAEGFTEADRVIRALPTIDPVTAAAEALGMSPDRLRELAQAYRLLGNTVYEPNKRGVISTYKVISVHFSGCSILVGWDLLDGIYSNLNGFEISALGKTVFLTREAAEAALKEKEAEHESNV